MARSKKKTQSRKLKGRLPETPPPARWKKALVPWAAFLIAVAVGAGLFGYTLRFPFQFDDESYLLRNPLLRDGHNFLSLFNFARVREMVAVQQLPDDVGTNFILRPFTYFTFYLNNLVAGKWDEAGCRMVNIAIHCLNGFLVFRLVAQLLNHSPKSRDLHASSSLLVPAAAALLFLVHPVQVESVTYIVQRFTSLGTLFFLLTLVLYFQAGVVKQRWMWTLRGTSVLAMIIGMLSKEEVFTAPIMMVMLDRLVMDTPWKTIARRSVPYVVCMAVIPVMIMALAMSDAGRSSKLLHAICIACPYDSSSYHWTYFFTQFRVIVIYMGLLLLPQRLNVDWDISESTTFWDPRVLGCFGIILAVLAGAYGFYRLGRREVRHSLIFCATAWFFVTLLASSSVIPLPDAMADHRVYLPSVGVMVVLACSMDLLRTEFFRSRLAARAVPFALALWIVGLSAATVVRNQVWRSGISLWADAALKSPGKFRPWGNLGVCYGVNKQLEEAKSCLRKAIALKKDYNMGYRNLAIILADQKKFEESIRVSVDGLKACGNDTMMYYNIAVAYCAIGRLNEGAGALRNGLKWSPNHFLSHFSLGDIYVKQARYDEAMLEYQTAAKLSPHDKRVPVRMSQVQSRLHGLAGR